MSIERFGYHSGDDLKAYQTSVQEQENDPASLKRTIAWLENEAKTDPSVKPKLDRLKAKLHSLAVHG
jgi:hypothetical protein